MSCRAPVGRLGRVAESWINTEAAAGHSEVSWRRRRPAAKASPAAGQPTFSADRPMAARRLGGQAGPTWRLRAQGTAWSPKGWRTVKRRRGAQKLPARDYDQRQKTAGLRRMRARRQRVDLTEQSGGLIRPADHQPDTLPTGVAMTDQSCGCIICSLVCQHT